jgi:hypothetical protein
MSSADHDLERLRQGGPDCPSEVMLHRLRAGELAEAQARAIQGHVDGCERCKALVARHAAGFSAWPEVDPVRMLAAIRRGAEERAARSAAGWRARLRAAFAPLALAGTVAVVVVLVMARPPDPGSGLRLKGGPVLHVFRQQAGAAVEVGGGEAVAPGEPLQLTMDLPADGLAQVAGVDPGGALYAIWPQGGASFAPVKAGAGQRVPGAFSLDGAAGLETFHLVLCPASAGSPSCRSQGAGQPLACSPGCTGTLVTLRRSR